MTFVLGSASFGIIFLRSAVSSSHTSLAVSHEVKRWSRFSICPHTIQNSDIVFNTVIYTLSSVGSSICCI